MSSDEHETVALGLGLGNDLGAGIGVAVGAVTGDLSFWLGIGIGLGAAMGTAMGVVSTRDQGTDGAGTLRQPDSTRGALSVDRAPDRASHSHGTGTVAPARRSSRSLAVAELQR